MTTNADKKNLCTNPFIGFLRLIIDYSIINLNKIYNNNNNNNINQQKKRLFLAFYAKIMNFGIDPWEYFAPFFSFTPNPFQSMVWALLLKNLNLE